MSYNKINSQTRMIQDGSHMYDMDATHKGIRGHVIAGYDEIVDPITGISTLGEVIIDRDNEVLNSGSLYALEKLFNVPADLNIAYLNDIMGIGNDSVVISDKYPKENHICLFNVGLGGAGAAYTDVKKVLQQQRSIEEMIPFRVVEERFEPGTAEYEKYWFSKELTDGKFAYYMKQFSKTPSIKALWKDAGDDKDGSTVTEDDYTSTSHTPIETFAQMVLTIEVTDLREYFDLYKSLEEARFNTLGICCGIRSTLKDGREEYKQVRQITALNFSNEMLHMNKDLKIIYRLYTA